MKLPEDNNYNWFDKISFVFEWIIVGSKAAMWLSLAYFIITASLALRVLIGAAYGI